MLTEQRYLSGFYFGALLRDLKAVPIRWELYLIWIYTGSESRSSSSQRKGTLNWFTFTRTVLVGQTPLATRSL